jgi:hypothetical protein
VSVYIRLLPSEKVRATKRGRRFAESAPLFVRFRDAVKRPDLGLPGPMIGQVGGLGPAALPGAAADCRACQARP